MNVKASTQKVSAGTPATIAGVRHYLGLVLMPDGTNAANVVVYRGTSAVAGNEVAAVRTPGTQSTDDAPQASVDTDPQSSLHVVVTGTGAYALVRYSQ